MKRLATAALIAVATASISWLTKRWLDGHHARRLIQQCKPIESWENEGGALPPQHIAVETSQVPR